MTFRQLEYFLQLALHKTFTKAADACYTTQPNLSRQIAKLEEEIGSQLFIRDKQSHSVKLTLTGEYFQKQAQQMILLYQTSLTNIQQLENSEQIRFGMMNGISTLFEIIKQLKSMGKYSNLQIIHLSGEQYLSENQVDICFLILPDNHTPNSMPLYHMQAPIVIPKHLCTSIEEITIDKLKTIPFSLPSGDAQNLVKGFLKKHGIKSRAFPSLIFDFESYMMDLLLNNSMGFLINDNLGKYEKDFYILERPEFTLELPIGIKWNPEKNQICKKIATDIADIYQSFSQKL